MVNEAITYVELYPNHLTSYIAFFFLLSYSNINMELFNQ